MANVHRYYASILTNNTWTFVISASLVCFQQVLRLAMDAWMCTGPSKNFMTEKNIVTTWVLYRIFMMFRSANTNGFQGKNLQHKLHSNRRGLHLSCITSNQLGWWLLYKHSANMACSKHRALPPNRIDCISRWGALVTDGCISEDGPRNRKVSQRFEHKTHNYWSGVQSCGSTVMWCMGI